MNNDLQNGAQKQLSALEHWMVPLFAKAPHLPQSARDVLVKIAPWLALLGGVLGIMAMLSAGMLGAMLSLSMFGYGLLQISMLLSFIASLIASVLYLLAFSPLRKMQKKGWNYIFYGMVLTIIVAILNMVLGYGSGALGTVIGALIGFWLMFEVRGMYR